MDDEVPESIETTDLRRMHRTVMGTIGVLATLAGVVVYLLFVAVANTRHDVRTFGDSALRSLSKAEDSSAVQHALLRARIDSLVRTRKR